MGSFVVGTMSLVAVYKGALALELHNNYGSLGCWDNIGERKKGQEMLRRPGETYFGGEQCHNKGMDLQSTHLGQKRY
jgi:hypothetical protein